MSFFRTIKKLPIDLGQKEMRYTSQGRLIALRLAGKGMGRSALDLGCSDGFWTEKLKKLGWKTQAVDSESCYPDCKITDLNRGIPFPDNAFDLVWSTETIAFLNNVDFVIKEMRRVLKPNGRFIITTPNNNFWLNYLLKIIGKSFKEILEHKQEYFFTIKDVKTLFPKAKIYGYFPYCFIKLRISKLVGFLSPTLIIEGRVYDF